MIDGEDSLPQFQHSASRNTRPAQTQQNQMKKSHIRAHVLAITQQRSGVRNQNLANQHDALEQLDGVLNSMFELLSDDVEPFIEDS